MAHIITVLGRSSRDCTTLAAAMAKAWAGSGHRVLFCTQDVTPAPSVLLGQTLTADPAALAPNLWGMQLAGTVQLEASWQQVKTLEAEYLRTPFLKSVYGQELGVLPGMDSALALNTLREFDASSSYDLIVYDGGDGMAPLRTLGMPEILDWYVRRFRGVFQQSDLGRALAPFIQPVAAAVLSVDWSGDILDQPTGQMRSVLEAGRDAVSDPRRVLAVLATSSAPGDAETARYLWGSAQQIGLSVGGVFATDGAPVARETFDPLPITTLPSLQAGQWDPLVAAIPTVDSLVAAAPPATTLDLAAKTVRLFLPSFDKTQVQLTQYGPEVTIEAGDQRRNLLLPPALAGRSVAGAKFQGHYLTLSFA